MVLKCGLNSRTYEPKGDGFAPDLAVALMVAVADFLKSLARVTGKLAVYSAQNCPSTCLPKVVATPDTLKDPVFDLKWQARQKRWHVRIGVKITRTRHLWQSCGDTQAEDQRGEAGSTAVLAGALNENRRSDGRPCAARRLAATGRSARAGLNIPPQVHVTLIPELDPRARVTPVWIVGLASGSHDIADLAPSASAGSLKNAKRRFRLMLTQRQDSARFHLRTVTADQLHIDLNGSRARSSPHVIVWKLWFIRSPRPEPMRVEGVRHEIQLSPQGR